MKTIMLTLNKALTKLFNHGTMVLHYSILVTYGSLVLITDGLKTYGVKIQDTDMFHGQDIKTSHSKM